MFRPNLDSILAGFNKTITQLDRLFEGNKVEAERLAELAKSMLNTSDGLRSENERVGAITSNLRNLIGQ